MTTASPRVQLLRRAWRKNELRRLCLASAGFRLAELGVWIALTAYAYNAGGVREASLAMVAELVPATGLALAVGGLIRRHGAAPVLRWGLAAQSAGMVMAAVLLRQGVNIGGYAGAVIAATAVTTTRPSLSVITPTLVDGPEELTAANVFSGWLVAAGGLAGPALAAVVMTEVGSWAVFALMAAVVAVAAAGVWRLPVARISSDEDPESLIAGIRATAREPGPRVMVVAIAAYYGVIGAFDVLAVVIAVELLRKTSAFGGYVTTAAGFGCVIGGAISLAVIGRRWLAPWVLISGLGMGLSLAAVSFIGSRLIVSIVALVVFGTAEGLYELTALMLLQRVSRLDLVGHIFALVEALQMAMLAVGAAIVPLAVQLFGSRWATAAIGGLLAIVVVVFATGIVRIDRNARVPLTEMAALRATPLFGALPGPALETVAREARRLEVPSGEVVVVQGDPGNAYYAVVSGRLVVSIDGEDRGEVGRGDEFGELALIRDAPRAATVRVTDDAVLLAVDREPFLTAVTGHPATSARAASIAASHLDPQ
jgi:hypothetical protein